MSKQKSKKLKSTQVQLGLNQPPALPDTQHDESSGDEEDPSNRTLLAAITALRGEMAKIKDGSVRIWKDVLNVCIMI